MVEELMFSGTRMVGNNVISNDGVFINGKKVAKRYYTRDGIKYGALALKNGKLYTQSTEKTKEKAMKSIRIFLGMFDHFKLNKISPLNEKAWSVKF